MTQPTLKSVFVLTGATATGKTAVAHILAAQMDAALLSADAMLVYQGLDLGTAKPPAAERTRFRYGGIDEVSPDQGFSVGAYRDCALAFLESVPDEQPVILVGGTGLYIKALLYGLDAMPPTDPALRAEIEALYAAEGLAALQAACRACDPARYAALKDVHNPRRVMRALELARMGVPLQAVWTEPTAQVPRFPGLTLDRTTLLQRIQTRVETMYAQGLLDEVAALQRQWPEWSGTAAQAIGYREARAVLEGATDPTTARAETVRRTRQYARRQETWLRNQFDVDWIDVDAYDPEQTAALVSASWKRYGPCPITS